MKKLFLVLFTLFLFVGNVFSQSIGAFVGYGTSAFSDLENTDQAGYVPVGAHILFGTGGNFEIGAEINYAAVPFTFDVQDPRYDFSLGETKIGQLYYGALAKFKIGSGGGILPYIRGGAGLYTGSIKMEYSEEFKKMYEESLGITLEDQETDLKSAFGFNVGGGAEIDFSSNNGIFAEFVYHFVKRELDKEGAESFTANNWAFHVGFHFGL
jgi:opacity protein-like surface antigen